MVGQECWETQGDSITCGPTQRLLCRVDKAPLPSSAQGLSFPLAFKNQTLMGMFVFPPASAGSCLCENPRPRAPTVNTAGAQQGDRRVEREADRQTRGRGSSGRGVAGWELLIHSHPFNRWPAICSGSLPQPRVQPS